MSYKISNNSKQIIAWALYDFANSAYFAVIFTFVFAAYFTEVIAENTISGTSLWSYTIAASGILIALTSPILGAIADYGGHHKRWLFCFTYLAIVSTGLLWFAYPTHNSTTLVLICIFISNFALEVGMVFYNAFLPQLAPKTYLGRVSGWAWGCGYLGGLLCLILALYVFINNYFQFNFTFGSYANVRSVPVMVAGWILIFSLPLFLFLKEKQVQKFKTRHAVKKGLFELFDTLKNLAQQKNLALFLIAHIFYIDGLNTLLALGGIYAVGTFHLSLYEVMVFGIVLNITAGVGAVLFALLDDWLGSKTTILLALASLLVTYCVLLGIHSVFLFWCFAPLIGIFVGPIQAASRTFLARLAKPDEITKMYGIYAFSGKATNFVGPLIVGLVTAHIGSQRAGMAALLPLFIVGGIFLLAIKEDQ